MGSEDWNTGFCLGLDLGVFATKGVLLQAGQLKKEILLPNGGSFLQAVSLCLEELLEDYRGEQIRCGLTGANAPLIAEEIGIDSLLEVEALQAGLSFLGLKPDALLSLGHENMYYLELDQEGSISYFNRNGQCAAGSGAFWYQQATRLGYNDRELAQVALDADLAVKISGRCAVFAKSDMTHAINEGASQSSVAAGLAQALVDLVVTNVCQNRIRGFQQFLVLGGVADNLAVLKYLQEYCAKRGAKLEVPPGHGQIPALGAAQKGVEIPLARLNLKRLIGAEYTPSHPLPPLDAALVKYLEPAKPQGELDLSQIYLGVDCGSVSTKCALLDRRGRLIGGEYLPTAGRPALQVLELMRQVEQKYGHLLENSVLVGCTTGSGRFLSQKILNSDYAIDEITCQAKGVQSLFPQENSLAIIEIGGEDSKFIQLKNGALADYNMNPVCAAGTGTFLENLAELLGVKIKEEFSKKAFQGKLAIDLGDTCTLLSQSTLVTETARGLPLESQLASLAYSSARNYLTRTLENRALEGKLVFTGATAKNHALASALAAQCQREIHVPPYPELSGAIGAALMAKTLQEAGEKKQSSLRSLAHLNSFEVQKQECRAKCLHEHNCLLDVISFADGSRFIYGDRCGRYSGLSKLNRDSNLPDYEKKWTEIFYGAAPEPRKKGLRVGLARGGLFYDLYPFFAGFFEVLGAQLILSDKTDEKTLEAGKTALKAEMCYPAEVLMGHYAQLASADLDYIFVPEAVTMEALPWAEKWPRSFTCPILQTFHRVVEKALQLDEERILYADIYFRDGPARVRANLREIGKTVAGPAYSEALLAEAVARGYQAWELYERGLALEGEQALRFLQREEEAVVALFLGRSYTLYDPFVSKNSFAFARQRGLFALPQDFLLNYVRAWYQGELESELLEKYRGEFTEFLQRMVERLENIYPAQLQRMLSTALICVFLNERAEETGLPILNIILQDPFKCGPNAMLRHYLSTLMGFLRLTLDEHTAPAGLITRLEAFKNTNREKKEFQRSPFYAARNVYVNEQNWSKVLIPDPSRHSRVLEAFFRNYGVEVEMLPRSEDKDLSLARRFSNGEECLPFLQNIQDMLEYLERNGDRPGTVMFQGWACGPCRYGLYAPTQSLVINRAGYGEARVSAVKLEDVLQRFGLDFVLGAYDGAVATDLLYKMLFASRPYEVEEGSSQKLFEHYWERLFEIMSTERFPLRKAVSGRHLRPLLRLLAEASSAFQKLPKREEIRPLILVGGEFYVRLDDRNNQDLLRKIEKAGGEACLAPACELFSYTAYIQYCEAKEKYRHQKGLLNYLSALGSNLLVRIARRDEEWLEKAASGLLAGLEEPSAQEIMSRAGSYVSKHYGGEPPMTLGRAAAFTGRERVSGCIFVAPFTCMPGSIVEAQQTFLQEEMGVPVITIYYDGRENANREEFIKSLVFQAKQKLRSVPHTI